MPQDQALPPVSLTLPVDDETRIDEVLTASVHDVRYLVSLLRGVHFVNRATVTVTDTGLTITVEEARTLLGTAFIFADVFDEYAFHPEPSQRPPRSQKTSSRPTRRKKVNAPVGQGELSNSETETESDEEMYKPAGEQEYHEEEDRDFGDNAAFEIPLNTLIECLNIFGTAGPAIGNITASSENADGERGGSKAGRRGRGRGDNGRGQNRGWRNRNDGGSDGSDGGDANEGNLGQRGLDAYFALGASEKRTGMRLSYPGGGYPLTLIIAEDASGPTTTCEITTFDPEPHLELDFDNSKTVLKIILKSSWLRDALSELDPSCEKLTFIGNPPASATQQQAFPEPDVDMDPRKRAKLAQKAILAKPMLRIQATGTVGSTEMDYPNDRDVLETFECTRNVNFSYRFGHIARTLKALSSSTKTSLRIDEDGLLSLQFLMPSPKPKTAAGRADAFIEFRCLALDDDI